MILKDFECPRCKHRFEDFEPSKDEIKIALKEGKEYCVICCPECGEEAQRIFAGRSAAILETIIPIYPGSKKHKAGYTHTSHADHPATKIQSGYGGCQGPPIQ